MKREIKITIIINTILVGVFYAIGRLFFHINGIGVTKISNHIECFLAGILGIGIICYCGLVLFIISSVIYDKFFNT